eukprot:410277-Prymnesium_polylepis.1
MQAISPDTRTQSDGRWTEYCHPLAAHMAIEAVVAACSVVPTGRGPRPHAQRPPLAPATHAPLAPARPPLALGFGRYDV